MYPEMVSIKSIRRQYTAIVRKTRSDLKSKQQVERLYSNGSQF